MSGDIFEKDFLDYKQEQLGSYFVSPVIPIKESDTSVEISAEQHEKVKTGDLRYKFRATNESGEDPSFVCTAYELISYDRYITELFLIASETKEGYAQMRMSHFSGAPFSEPKTFSKIATNLLFQYAQKKKEVWKINEKKLEGIEVTIPIIKDWYWKGFVKATEGLGLDPVLEGIGIDSLHEDPSQQTLCYKISVKI